MLKNKSLSYFLYKPLIVAFHSVSILCVSITYIQDKKQEWLLIPAEKLNGGNIISNELTLLNHNGYIKDQISTSILAGACRRLHLFNFYHYTLNWHTTKIKSF